MGGFGRRMVSSVAMAALVLAGEAAAAPGPGEIGIAILHGKANGPDGSVASLAERLQKKGYLVAVPRMPWSGTREYDVPVAAAERELDAVLDGLRKLGASRVFVAGHSEGGVFALHFATSHAIDGLILIAPGASVASAVFSEKVGPSLEKARSLIAEGKGGEKAELSDHEGKRGMFIVSSRPSAYVTWFDPEGGMNRNRSAKRIPPGLPVLFIVPTRDYDHLLRQKQKTFELLPPNPLTRLYEPDSDHQGSSSASLEEIVRWIGEVTAPVPSPGGVPARH